ncbi:MAG: PEP-CTERM sorting domain-containing protein [Pseudomonadota bacterium]
MMKRELLADVQSTKQQSDLQPLRHLAAALALAFSSVLLSTSASAALMLSVTDDTVTSGFDFAFRTFDVTTEGQITDINVTVDFEWVFPDLDPTNNDPDGLLAILFTRLDGPDIDFDDEPFAFLALFADEDTEFFDDTGPFWLPAAGTTFDGAITFDESAALPIDTQAPTAGTFRSISFPSAPADVVTNLNLFNGAPLPGTWGVTVFLDGDVPLTLNSVTVDFEYELPVPATIALLGLGVVGMGARRRIGRLRRSSMG